jgi:uncharacterized protein
LQLDPTAVVARNHQLVLWSRLGAYDAAAFERMMWEERKLFEYWAHAASICLTENYPLHRIQMRLSDNPSGWTQRMEAWVDENLPLRETVIRELQTRGPLQLKKFPDDIRIKGGWSTERTTMRMIDYLWTRGQVLVHSRRAQSRLWHLAEQVLPADTPRQELDDTSITRRAAQIALRALGVAPLAHIRAHFLRGHYPQLQATLDALERENIIERVQITTPEGALKSAWYLHQEDVPLLERIEQGDWADRTTLLSPFDNLICDRKRTELLWDFYFRLEIYTPKHKRQYGYFVMPILHGDRLIGRIDPMMERAAKRLRINAMHYEPGIQPTAAIKRAVFNAIESLAAWQGATTIDVVG